MQTLFITGHRKSGTTMLASLFDGHKDLSVYPTDLSLMYAYYPNFNNDRYSYQQKIKRIKLVLKKSLSKNLSYRIEKKKINIDIFINKILIKINKKNINDIFKIFSILKLEYNKFFKQNHKKYFVIKETSADICFNQIFKKNDQIKFLHLIRDPRDNFASLKSGHSSYYSKLGEDNLVLLSSMINRAKFDFDFIEKNKKIFGKKNYLVIKYEQLVKKPENVTKKICKFLKIKFNKILLKPTIFQSEIKNNTFTKKKDTKINQRSVLRWKKELTKFEIDIINYYFKRDLKKYYKIDVKNIEVSNLTDYYKLINKKFFYKDSF